MTPTFQLVTSMTPFSKSSNLNDPLFIPVVIWMIPYLFQLWSEWSPIYSLPHRGEIVIWMIPYLFQLWSEWSPIYSSCDLNDPLFIPVVIWRYLYPFPMTPYLFQLWSEWPPIFAEVHFTWRTPTLNIVEAQEYSPLNVTGASLKVMCCVFASEVVKSLVTGSRTFHSNNKKAIDFACWSCWSWFRTPKHDPVGIVIIRLHVTLRRRIAYLSVCLVDYM